MFHLHGKDGLLKHEQGMETFGKRRAKEIVESLLTRKQRGAGISRYLFNQVRMKGVAEFTCLAESGFVLTRSKLNRRYSLRLFGLFTGELLERTNKAEQQRIAIRISQKQSALRRKLYAKKRRKTRSVILPPVRKIIHLPTRLHFKRSKISRKIALLAIARACGQSYEWAARALIDSTTLTLNDGFVFKLKQSGEWYCIYTVPNKHHHAYRRLRNVLRQLLNKNRKARAARGKLYKAQLKHRFRTVILA